LHSVNDQIQLNFGTIDNFWGHWADLQGVSFIQVDEWHHATITYDGTLIKLYLDGILDRSEQMSLGLQVKQYILFNGIIDDIPSTTAPSLHQKFNSFTKVKAHVQGSKVHCWDTC
jgi:Concanavalin A-like lectin/glucanases superfamily